jgi:protein-L-isoaspartate(D-aspartate) O-methyltransferase
MKQMIKELIGFGYLKTPRIIDAFQRIDRKNFVIEEYKDEAYINAPLPIGYGQTISQPLTVAFMLELLQPTAGDKILEIGAGSGWQTALLADIVGEEGKIFAVELIPELEQFGRQNVSKYNFIEKKIVNFFCYNAINGMPEQAPFDKIISAASADRIPEEWKKQLKIEGRLVIPVKDAICLLIKKDADLFEEQSFPGFAFVPFVE